VTVAAALADAMDDAMTPLGFRRRRTNWSRLGDTLYSVINLQKSRWGEWLYVNLGFSLPDRVANSWTPESRCLVRFRADTLTAIEPEALRLLEADRVLTMEHDELRELLAERIASPIAETMAVAADLDGLKNVLESRTSGQVFVHREMRELLLSLT
jgi:hypothetical protein